MMNCDICMEAFNADGRKPKSLPCGHTYCLHCLQQMEDNKCPVDNKKFAVQPADLPDTYKLLEASRRRFWCQICRGEAQDACFDEHFVCCIKKGRLDDSHTLLSNLQEGEVTSERLRLAVEYELPGLAEFPAALGLKRAEFAEARRRLVQAAREADDASWEQAKADASGVVQSGRDKSVIASSELLGFANLDDDPGATVTVQAHLGKDAGSVAWSGRRRLSARGAAALVTLLAAEGFQPSGAGESDQEQGVKKETDKEREGIQQAAVAGEEDVGNAEVEVVLVKQGEQVDEVVGEDSAWEESPNDLSPKEMALRITEGCRVQRGRDWGWGVKRTRPIGCYSTASYGECCNEDGVPPGDGICKGVSSAYRFDRSADVRWNAAARDMRYMISGTVVQLKLRGKQLKNLPVASEASPKQRDGLSTPDLRKVSGDSDSASRCTFVLPSSPRAVVGLVCNVDPAWSRAALKLMSASVEELELISPQHEHMLVVQGMPRLQSLHLRGLPLEDDTLPLRVTTLRIASVTRPQLQQVSRMPSLRRLEVHCPFDAPLPGVAFRRPAAPAGLQWLRTGLYPLSTALALVRAHAASLETLELVAASRRPYGCPDLAAELRKCELKSLRKLYLLRDSDGMCQHLAYGCKRQKIELWSMLLDSGLVVTVLCSECDEISSHF